MHEADARVIEVAREIVARYRQHLGPLGAQALVDAVDASAVARTPYPAEAPTGILDLTDPMTIVPTATVFEPNTVNVPSDPRDRRAGPDPRSDPRTDPRPDPRPRPLRTENDVRDQDHRLDKPNSINVPSDPRDPFDPREPISPRDPISPSDPLDPRLSQRDPRQAKDIADFGTLQGAAPVVFGGEPPKAPPVAPPVTPPRESTARRVIRGADEASKAEVIHQAEVNDPTNS